MALLGNPGVRLRPGTFTAALLHPGPSGGCSGLRLPTGRRAHPEGVGKWCGAAGTGRRTAAEARHPVEGERGSPARPSGGGGRPLPRALMPIRVPLPFQDGKVNGVTESTRILGYTFLHPSVVPRPHVQSVPLTPQDEFFILGSKGLWDSLSSEEAVAAVRPVPDALAAAKKLCTLAQSYGCHDSLSAVVVQLSVPEDSFCCCELGAGGTGGAGPPPSPGLFPPPGSAGLRERPADAPGVPSSSSGLASEMSSELSTSEMSSEVGSTASDEPPAGALAESSPAYASEPRCALHPGGAAHPFQRQLSSATFSSAFSDNGLDSDDEAPIAGVFSNGSRVEVEVDIHCGRAKDKEPQRLPPAPADASDEGIVISANEDELGPPRRADGPAAGTIGRRRANGSVAPQERSHNVIEVAADAPLRKPGGYFAAPAQPDPEDQFIIPPELEEEVKEMMKRQPPPPPCPGDPLPDYCDTPL